MYFKSIVLIVAIIQLSIHSPFTGHFMFVSGSTISSPYPDANARPTITTKLENLSELHRSIANTTTTTSTEGYPSPLNGDENYGNYNFMLSDPKSNYSYINIVNKPYGNKLFNCITQAT